SPTSAREPFVARQVNRLAPDVVFSPMQTMGSWGRRYPLALTVHDLIYYTHRTPPRDLPAPVRLLWRLYHLAWWPQRLLLNRADAVVTVSETTRALIARHRLTKRPVTVVPNAAEVPPARERTRPEGIELVYMGSFMPYKGVDTLVAALHHLPGARLHLASRIPAAERDRLTEAAPAGSLVIHDGVDDSAYAELLDRATALVHASREEGFGIPLVEAMGRGTPIVVADTAIFREIGGDTALYFPVDDADSLAAAVRRLTEPGEWERCSAAGPAEAVRFDWDASATALDGLLRTLAAIGETR
ncbi:MAG: glycosyltransferase family 4 protein, partial [Microcella sp.]